MAKTFTALAAGLAGAPTAVGANMSPAATSAEVSGLALVLSVLAKRPDVADQILALAFSQQKSPSNAVEPTGINQVLPG